jgi:hypothetical protein
VLLETSDESETRTLTIVGAAVVLCVVLVGALLMVSNPFGGRPKDQISLTIETPYGGQGVNSGTGVVLHGVKVGEVKDMSTLPGGAVRLKVDLQIRPTANLTDAMRIDFRPVNYFGVTGINLTAGEGGRPLRDGMEIQTVPEGNFTLQALLTRLSKLTAGVVTPQLIQVIDRATRYTDALNPLLETAITAVNAVAETQTVSTARLLTTATGVSVPFPGFVNGMVTAGNRFITSNMNQVHKGMEDVSDADFETAYVPILEEASGGLFAAVGRLESKHVIDLLPIIGVVKSLTDTAPPLFRPEDIAQTLVELRSRLEKMWGGTPEQRALQVRIVLDSLPGVAAPIGAMGGP